MLAMVVGLLLLASCRTTRNVSTGGMENLSESAFLHEVVEHSVGLDALSAKMRLIAKIGGEEIGVGGSIKMKKDEAIQLSLVAIGIVEAARIELTPERMLVLDRLGRRYVEIPYTELAFFRDSDIDFYTLQALFWNELFLPGVKQVGEKDAGRFGWLRDETQVHLSAEGKGGLVYTFLTALADGRLQETNITKKGGRNYRMAWGYDEFEAVARRKFPTRMKMNLQGGKVPLEAEFHFSRLSAETELQPLSIPRKYQRMEADDILKILTQQ